MKFHDWIHIREEEWNDFLKDTDSRGWLGLRHALFALPSNKGASTSPGVAEKFRRVAHAYNELSEFVSKDQQLAYAAADEMKIAVTELMIALSRPTTAVPGRKPSMS